jgi:hypothetical protein
LDEFCPKRREDRLLGTAPFQNGRIQLAFKRDHAGGKGGLRDTTGRGSAAEMLIFGQRHKVAKLLRGGQRDHRIFRL